LPEAYGGSASCSDVPRLLLRIVGSTGGHDKALLGIVEAFARDCQGFCARYMPWLMCARCMPRLMCARGMPRPLLKGANLWCSSHAESAQGMMRLFSFSPLELFSGFPPIVGV
jgi:hypothetical protein